MPRRKKLRVRSSQGLCSCNPLALFLIGVASITTFINVYFGILNKEMMPGVRNKNNSINLDVKLGLCRLKDARWPRVTRDRGLNAHVWCELCLKTTLELCRYPLFPHAPTARDTIATTRIRRRSKLFGQRIFGFIEPPTSGFYRFELSASDVSELWLSADHRWENAKRIARVDRNITTGSSEGKSPASGTQTSDKINLEQGRQYFLDIINLQSKQDGFLEVRWKRPQNDSFEVIDSNYLSFFLNETGVQDRGWIFDHKIPKCASCALLRNITWNEHFLLKQNLPYIDHAEISSVLPYCTYDPSYAVSGRKLKQWEAVRNDKITIHTYTKPLPNFKAVKDENGWHFELSKCQVEDIVAKYMFRLHESLPGKFKLHAIRQVERKNDVNGSRFLLDLELQRIQNKKIGLLSEYIYYSFKEKNGTLDLHFYDYEGCRLCYPKGLQWNRTADVHFVVTAKNQGRWIQHLLSNMARIYSQTKDQNIHLVIFDYNSTDINLEYALNKTLFPRLTFVQKSGKFLKTHAYNNAVRTVSDPNAIIFLLDLHYEISSNLITNIRKHVVRGKMVYTPIIVRLDCGSLPYNPSGYWEDMGFGPIAMYKYDWNQIGGFVKHREGWGGEDWDLIDQVAKKGLEFERSRTPYMYHYFHTHKGMWKV